MQLRGSRSRARRSPFLRKAHFVVAAAASLLLLASVLAPSLATSASAAEIPVIHISQTVSPAYSPPTSAVGLNGRVTFTYNVECSSLTTECDNFQVTDTIPAPFVLDVVSSPSGVHSTVKTTGNSFTVSIIQPLDDGTNGLDAGGQASFTATAHVPSSGVPYSYNGTSVTNPATASATNGPTPVTASTQVLLSIPLAPSATIAKKVAAPTGSTPAKTASINSTPGLTSTFSLAMSNTSNAGADTLTVQDPVDVSANPFRYAQVTGITIPSGGWPGGANRVEVDWFDAGGWHAGTAAAAIALPAGVDPKTIEGLRFIFSKTSGTIAAGDTGEVDINTALSSDVASAPTGTTINNIASDFVTISTKNPDNSISTVSSTPATDSAQLSINSFVINPQITKKYAQASILGGTSDEATVTATNAGNYKLKSMVVTEPAAGHDNLVQQGFTFTRWDDQNTSGPSSNIQWPASADPTATIEYLYDGDATYSAAQSATPSLMPEPDPSKQVDGFRITFTNSGTGFAPGEYAVLPFFFTTPAVTADENPINWVSLDVVTEDNQTAQAVGNADLTLRTARVNTSITKAITPPKIYSTAGARSIVTLPGQVDPYPTSPTDTGGSTVGADSLTIRDPEDPTQLGFWNDFNATKILSTSVPVGTTMSVSYWDVATASWLPLTGAQGIVGSTAAFSYTLTPTQQSDAAGLEFIFTPNSGTLAPGFEVSPNIQVALRAVQRSDGITKPNASTTNTVTVDNVAESLVHSGSTTPADVTADDTASIKLLPLNGAGGVDLITKAWLQPTINARSNESATAQLRWGTGSLNFASVVISDTQDDPTNVADTVYDAFNLTGIPAITSGMDPELTFDEVSKIELFYPGTGPGTGWQEPSDDPCPTACGGTFPGYTLSSADQQLVEGVRLTFIENPNRAFRTNPPATDPQAGDGVTATTDESRKIDLIFQLRNTKRSDGSPVLGISAGATYNDPADAPAPAGSFVPGAVLNTVREDGRDATNTTIQTDTSSDVIDILDPPVNVLATKSWTDGPLGLPPVGTDQSLYPTAELNLSGTNNSSTTTVDELSLTDPTGGDDPFDYVDIAAIDGIACPANSVGTVTFTPAADFAASYSLADVQDQSVLTPTELANATGITVDCVGAIAPGGQVTVAIDARLRATKRGTTDSVLPDPVNTPSETIQNEVTVSVTDPEVYNRPDHTTSKTAAAGIDIESYNYGVEAVKTINPNIQLDGASPDTTITLSGQPTGNVPTTSMVIDDFTPTFWNAYKLKSLNNLTFSQPIDSVEVDALVGVTYVVTTPALPALPQITAECHGSTDLSACWYDGAVSQATAMSLPATVPPGTTLSDAQGLRFTFTEKNGAGWERVHNPVQTVSFTATRRDDLVTGGAVEDDLYTNTTPAPGETEVGVFTNTVNVNAYGGWWHAQDSDTQQIQYEHVPADVSITKTPTGSLSLGQGIPYSISVTNPSPSASFAGNKTLSNVVVTDILPGDAAGPYLVLPNDPDTGNPEAPSDAFSYSLKNGSTVTTPSVTASVGAYDFSTHSETITFTLASGQSIPLGATLTINTTLDFRAGLAAGTPVTNTATVVSDQVYDNCDYTINGVPETTQQDVATCTTQTTVIPEPSAPLSIIKGVRGVSAGPLATDGTPLIDPSTSLPYDDLGVEKTVSTSLNDCSTTNPALALDGTKGFYSYPCVPVTRPGGTEEWENQFTNGGNIALEKVVAIDVLPTAGDTGVILPNARGSAWTPTLTSYPLINNLPAGASYVVDYTATTGMATALCNGADIQDTMGMTATSAPAMLQTYQDNCLTDSGHAGDLADRTWTTLPSAPVSNSAADVTAYGQLLASVVAMKFIVTLGDGTVTSPGLAPGGAIDVTYRTQTANNIDLPDGTDLGVDSIAYNSVAGAAIGLDPAELPYPFVSEPRKVGVALATGGINLEKLVSGPAKGLAPPTFSATVTCKSNNVPVAIFDSSGTARNPFVLTPGSPLLVNGLPLYSVCTVAEIGSPNDTSVTITPTGAVRAEASHVPVPSEGTIYNPHPAFDAGTTSFRPAVPLVTITNDYQDSNFVVSKAIDNGGAVDASGAAIVYTAPTFTAKCTFNNGVKTVTTLATQTFTLASGASIAFPGATLPAIAAGSVCTVTEINSQKAASEGYLVAANGAPVTSGTTTVAKFTLAAYTGGAAPANRVSFRNHYTVGSLTINKTVSGDAASTWGNHRAFAVSVNCTYTNNSTTPVTSTVYSKTITLTSPGDLSRTISDLPTGAVCSINETDAQGATKTTYDTVQTATIGTADTALGITNEFDNATLTVSKVVNTAAHDADDNVALPGFDFPFSVDCTFQGDHVAGDGFSSSPMTFTLKQATSQVISGLPAGAVCTVTETDVEGADSTTVAVASAADSSSVVGTSASLTLTPDNAVAPLGTNTAVVTNDYGTTSFTITKALAGAGAAQFAPADFIVHVTCSAPGIPISYDGDIDLKNPGSMTQTITNLAENSVCSAVEQHSPTTGADAETVVDSSGHGTGLGVLATAGAPGTVTITNWYLTGSIAVTKQVTGAASSYGDTAGQFKVALSCTRDGVAVNIPGGDTRTVSHGDTVTYTDLPSGSACTLQETDNGSATSSAILDSTNAVVAADATSVYTLPALVTVDPTSLTDNQVQPSYTIRNTFDPASLTVTKHVTGGASDQDGNAVSYGPFPVSVVCTFNGAGNTVFTGSKNLAKDESWTIPNLVTGAVCAVTETDTMSAHATSIDVTTGSNDPVTTSGSTVTGIVLAADTADTSNSAVITNTYQTGTITLSKSVIGAGAADWGKGPFTITVTCSLTDESGTRTVWDQTYHLTGSDPAVTLTDVAAGATCTVTETKTVGANSTTITLDTASPSIEKTATFTSPTGSTFAVVVTNEFDLSSINVTKIRDGAGAALYGAGPFQVSLACTRDLDGVDTDFDIPGGATRDLNAAGGYVATYTGLPADASCDATETLVGGATSTVISPSSFTTDSGTPTELNVTNTFDEGSIEVDKTITGQGALLYGNGPFEVSLACTRVVNGATVPVTIPGGPTRELTGLNNYINTFDQLPVNATCTISETKTHGSTSSAFTTPTTMTIVAGNPIKAKLTNEFDIGYITVNNLVTGNDAKHHYKNTFEVVLSCNEMIDGVETPIDIPGGATRDIWHKTSISYDDLPIGATCGLIESVTNNSEKVTITWHGFSVPTNEVTIGSPDFKINVVNVFNIFPGDTLAFTGLDVGGELIVGLLGLLAGAAFYVWSFVRRRRRERGTA